MRDVIISSMANRSSASRPLRRHLQSEHRRGSGAGPAERRGRTGAAVRQRQGCLPAWSMMNPKSAPRVMFESSACSKPISTISPNSSPPSIRQVVADSKGDVQRRVSTRRFACGIPHLQKGEYTRARRPRIDVHSMRTPLGVVAASRRFNFPAMIPCWMSAVAIACRQHVHPEASPRRPIGGRCGSPETASSRPVARQGRPQLQSTADKISVDAIPDAIRNIKGCLASSAHPTCPI